MTYLTPDVDIQAEGGFAFRQADGAWQHDRDGRGRLFKDPYPLSEKLYLVAHKPAGPKWSEPEAYGLYLLDEPEAALSPKRQLAILTRIHDLVGEKSQFIIATHSPILMAFPDAYIYQFSPSGIERVAYEEALPLFRLLGQTMAPSSA